MSIGAFVGVLDEVELIGSCIDHLRQIGVDYIVACDYGSSDGTLDVLETQHRTGDVLVVRVDPKTVPDYASWSAHHMVLAEQVGTDWMLFLDADEFCIPASGSLRDCRYLAEAEVLTVERFNVPVTDDWHMRVNASPANYNELLLFARYVPNYREYVETHPEVPFISIIPPPKVMARWRAIQGLEPGAHGVSVRAGTPIRSICPPDLLIAHVPFSTVSRFHRKVENIRSELMRNQNCYSGDLAWHWKRWVTMAQVEGSDQLFARQVLDERTLELLRREGILRSATELFTEPSHRYELQQVRAQLSRTQVDFSSVSAELAQEKSARARLEDVSQFLDAFIETMEPENRRLEGENCKLEAELCELNSKLSHAQSEIEDISTKLLLCDADRISIENSCRRVAQELEWRTKELCEARSQCHEEIIEQERIRSDLAIQRAMLQRIQVSTSWRITTPLRWTSEHVPQLKKRLRGPLRFLWRVVTLQLPRGPQLHRDYDYDLIMQSGLFDGPLYLERNPDVAQARVDPLYHYLSHGALEGRDPHPLFDSDWYLQRNSDVAAAGINPLVHYLRHGWKEGRNPHPLFDGVVYLEQNPDVARDGINPLVHYVANGSGEPTEPTSRIRRRLALGTGENPNHENDSSKNYTRS